MSRIYKKRTKSTKAKTYDDYLKLRSDLKKKGYALKDKMDKSQFENYYESIRKAKRAGEIKSQPWQYLKSKTVYLSDKQANMLSKASKEMEKRGLLSEIKTSFSKAQIKKQDSSIIRIIGKFLSETQHQGLYDGDYE